MDFVGRVTKSGGPDFVPVPERIAAFDNDGTLWAEKPVPFQLLFAFDRSESARAAHPEWKTTEPFASLLKGDMAGVAASGEKGVLELVTATHAGMTTDEFAASVARLDRHRQASRNRPPVDTRWSTSPCSSCSPTCAPMASRHSSSRAAASSSCGPGPRSVYGIPPEQVVGSAVRLKLDVRDGKPVLIKLPELDFIDDKEGKPVGIQTRIGRRPIAAFGNSDGDLADAAVDDGGHRRPARALRASRPTPRASRRTTA